MKPKSWRKVLLSGLITAGLIMSGIVFLPVAGGAPLPGVEPLGKIALTDTKVYSPSRVAVGADGTLYVVDTRNNNILKYDRNGSYAGKIIIPHVIAIEASSDGTLYIAANSDRSVAIYRNGAVAGHLGKGANEFVSVSDISVDGISGIVCVSDSSRGEVKLFDAEGTALRTIAAFKYPLGIACTGNDIYVLDTPEIADPSSSGKTTGARVSVYSQDGSFKRSFSDHTTSGGHMFRPNDIAFGDDGKVYIPDSFNKQVYVYSSAGSYLGEVTDPAEQMNTSVSLDIGGDGRLFVTSNASKKMFIFGLPGYTFMAVSPLSLGFTGQQGGSNPAAQSITIGNQGNGVLTYDVTTSEPWIAVGQTSGTVSAQGTAGVDIGVNAAGLAAGTYSGTVTVSGPGAVESVQVTLEILPQPSLIVTPASLTFDAVYGNGNPPAQIMTVQVENDVQGIISWTASSGSSWLNITPSSGSGGVITQSSVAVDLSGVAPGMYAGAIVIDGAGTDNSPVTVPVTLNLVTIGTINVATNTGDAAFTITGPDNAVYTGNGTSWSKTGLGDGDYRIEYTPLAGFVAPPSETLTITNGGTIDFAGNYVDLRQNVNILASHGPGNKDSSDVTVYLSDGTPVLTITPFPYNYGSSTAIGDVDGDGSQDIIAGVGPGSKVPAEVKAFNRAGAQIPGLDYLAHDTKFGVVVASADFDGDDKDEIISGQGKSGTAVRIVSYENGAVFDTGVNENVFGAAEAGVRVAAADVDGDGTPELIVAPQDTTVLPVVKIYRVNVSAGPGNWSLNLLSSFTACETAEGTNITTGDVNADGIKEIMTVCRIETGTEVRIFTGQGTLINSFPTGSTRRNYIAAGDTDMDGIAEIMVGSGPANHFNMVSVFSAQGVLIRNFEAFPDSFGVRVSAGNLGYQGVAQ